MNKFIKLIVGISGIVLLFTGCASSSNNDDVFGPNIKAFNNAKSQNEKLTSIRLDAIQDTARSVGAQAALYFCSQKYNRLLDQNSKALDRIYNFNVMMVDKNVLAPVLSQGDDILSQDSDDVIRITDRLYKIERNARFVTAVPTYRDYLEMSFDKPAVPDRSLLPKTNEERDLWNKSVVEGWNAGIDQAKDIFQINVDRLTRDYRGMILYRKLLAQNMVTKPYIAKAEYGIVGDDDNMRINDQVLRITAVSKLQSESNDWVSRLHNVKKTSLRGK